MPTVGSSIAAAARARTSSNGSKSTGSCSETANPKPSTHPQAAALSIDALSKPKRSSTASAMTIPPAVGKRDAMPSTSDTSNIHDKSLPPSGNVSRPKRSSKKANRASSVAKQQTKASNKKSLSRSDGDGRGKNKEEKIGPKPKQQIQDTQSRRLVEYFVVVSSKPRVRKRALPQKEQLLESTNNDEPGKGGRLSPPPELPIPVGNLNEKNVKSHNQPLTPVNSRADSFLRQTRAASLPASALTSATLPVVLSSRSSQHQIQLPPSPKLISRIKSRRVHLPRDAGRGSVTLGGGSSSQSSGLLVPDCMSLASAFSVDSASGDYVPILTKEGTADKFTGRNMYHDSKACETKNPPASRNSVSRWTSILAANRDGINGNKDDIDGNICSAVNGVRLPVLEKPLNTMHSHQSSDDDDRVVGCYSEDGNNCGSTVSATHTIPDFRSVHESVSPAQRTNSVPSYKAMRLLGVLPSAGIDGGYDTEKDLCTALKNSKGIPSVTGTNLPVSESMSSATDLPVSESMSSATVASNAEAIARFSSTDGDDGSMNSSDANDVVPANVQDWSRSLPTPSRAKEKVTLSSAPVLAPDYKTLLIHFYEKHNPPKVSDVDKLMHKFKGKEIDMFDQVSKKYNAPNPLDKPTFILVEKPKVTFSVGTSKPSHSAPSSADEPCSKVAHLRGSTLSEVAKVGSILSVIDDAATAASSETDSASASADGAAMSISTQSRRYGPVDNIFDTTGTGDDGAKTDGSNTSDTVMLSSGGFLDKGMTLLGDFMSPVFKVNSSSGTTTPVTDKVVASEAPQHSSNPSATSAKSSQFFGDSMVPLAAPQHKPAAKSSMTTFFTLEDAKLTMAPTPRRSYKHTILDLSPNSSEAGPPPSIREGGANENIRVPGDGDEAASSPTSSSDLPSSELVFTPTVTARYPLEDHEDNPLNPMLIHFCHPRGDTIELTTEYCMPRIHYFVLTNDRGNKLYGTCLTVFEEYVSPPGAPAEEEEALMWYKAKGNVHSNPQVGNDIEVTISKPGKVVYVPRVLCLLSTWPYLASFREYLTQLYRLATMTNLMTAPIERYILNICEEIPAPPPGAFEIRLSILSSTIRFWAPPANQPIPYVALPFRVLFECLDINNVLFVWYALALERKILLVSSQYSLLTLCSEILCSLLFPMCWRHLYIPILPRFLTPMLDAPMPYLCGISRDNFSFAIGDISDDAIVVDLDQNLITMGDATVGLPPIPLKRRIKLETALEENAGEVFWMARGLTKLQVMKHQSRSGVEQVEEFMDKAELAWQERLTHYDEAFSLAYEPDSQTLINDELPLSGRKKSYANDKGQNCEQSQWDAVQEAFLRFYVAMLQGYREFLCTPESLAKPKESQRWSQERTFRSEDFLSSRRSDFLPFLEELCLTQQFDDFITKRLYNPGEPDVIFFDQSITAKLNRSRIKFKKIDTPFLQSSKAHKKLNSIDAVSPNCKNLPLDKKRKSLPFNLLDQLYAATEPETKQTFMYTIWPEKFDLALFDKARPIPDFIAAEFDRQAALSNRLRVNYNNADDNGEDDFSPGHCDPSPEIATFTVFFIVYTALIGRELAALEKQMQTELGLEIDDDGKDHFDSQPAVNKPLNGSVDATARTLEDTCSVVEPFMGKLPPAPSYAETNLEVGRRKMADDELVEEGNDGRCDSLIPDCTKTLCSANWVSSATSSNVFSLIANVTEKQPFERELKRVESLEQAEELPQLHKQRSPEIPRNCSVSAVDIEEAKLVANAELDLAFDTLGMMKLRKLFADPDVYKALMEACGRCGDTRRATHLMSLGHEDGHVADSEMYSCYISAFSVSHITRPDLFPFEAATPTENGTMQKSSNHIDWRSFKRKFTVSPSSISMNAKGSSQPARQIMQPTRVSTNAQDTVSELLSDTASSIGSGTETPSSILSSSTYKSGWDTVSWFDDGRSTKSATSRKAAETAKKKKTTKKKDLIVTDYVAKQIGMGENLLEFLYSDLSIETGGDSCPCCSRIIKEDDEISGWTPCAFNDYTTSCPDCKHRFVPRFTVKCSTAGFEGTQGKGTPLYCEFLSPWVLRKELHNLTKADEGIECILRPDWRSGRDINSTLWWNMIVLFRRYGLPITFLLQGSFTSRLIMPKDDN